MPQSILSPEEVATYRRDGYIVPRFRLEGDDLAGLQQAVAHLVEDNPTLLDQSIVGPHVPGMGVQGVKVRSPEYWKRTGDLTLVNEIMPSLERAEDWIEETHYFQDLVEVHQYLLHFGRSLNDLVEA